MSLEEGKSWLSKEHFHLDTPENLAEVQAGFERFSSLPIASTCWTVEGVFGCFSLSNAIGEPKSLKLGNQLIAEGAIQA